MLATHRSIALTTLVCALSGCSFFVDSPKLGIVKSPLDQQCDAADCPTIEIPAPLESERYNPANLGQVDGKSVDFPIVGGPKGMVWWTMKVTPGTHQLAVSTREDTAGKDVGTALLEGVASLHLIDFEAQAGKRYWL